VHLTFDDGPQPGWTDRVLDTLAGVDERATFFVLGEYVAAAPELVQRTVAEGHEVGLHGDRHLRHSEHTREEIEADALRALDRLEALGVRPARWRPPWGVETADTRMVAQRLGLELVGWTVDTHDWRGDSAAAMLARCGAAAVEPGAVVLLHDGPGPGARRSHCDATVELTEALLERARGVAA
jgi:peptidoglycan/xylan/chitin deacetylase (PgdA/CDA1 family)